MDKKGSMVDFIIDASNDQELRTKFLKLMQSNPDEHKFKDWFAKKNYIVTDEEYYRIITNIDKIIESIESKKY